MIWLVSTTRYDYDEYDSFVVRAETSERALELVKQRFSAYQRKKITVEPVPVDGPEEEILGSFNAG